MNYQIKRILLAKTPRFIVLENVRNLLTHDHHNTWNVIKKELDEAGYNFKAIVMRPLLHLKWATDYDDIYEELKVQSKDHLIHQPPVKK